MIPTPAKRIRQFHGSVVSAKTPRTLVVEVARTARHPRYGKTYTIHQRFCVHDPRGQFRLGDAVRFVACRPISRTKRWRVLYEKIQNESIKM